MTIADAVEAGVDTLTAVAGYVRDVARRLQDEIETVTGPVLREVDLRLGRRRADVPVPVVPHGPPGGPQAQVEEAKYFLGAGRPAHVVDRETGALPRTYGRDRLVLLPRDPWWLFAYWELTPATRVAALHALGPDAEGAREVLRVHDVTLVDFDGENSWSAFDVDFAPGAESWYVNVGKPGASFCAELGLRTPSGRFVPLTRSNAVQTPPAQPGPEGQVRWVTLRPHAGGGAPGVAWSGRYVPVEHDDLGGSSDLHPPR